MRQIKWINFLEQIIPIGKKRNATTTTIITSLKQEIYFKELALYTAISYIANAISMCEVKTYESNKEVKNKSYYIMNLAPNINQNSSQFWHKVIENMFYEGEALVVTIDNKIYCADSYSPDIDPILGDKYVGVTIDGKQIQRTFKSDEVYLFKLDNKEVKNLIDGLYNTYGELVAYAAKSYKKSNASKYKLKMPTIKVGDDEFNDSYQEVLEEQLKQFMENDNAVYPEYEGYELEDISPKSNLKDSKDIVNLRKDIFELTAQALNIPQSLMLGNITNMNEVVRTFITFAIDPLAEMVSEELTRKQGNNYEKSFELWSKGNYYKVDTSTINHIDVLDVAEKVDKLISSGVMCVDDILGILGRDKLNTEFSKTHFITKNYDTIENRLKGENEKNE